MLQRLTTEAWQGRNEKGYFIQEKLRSKLTGTQRLAPGVLTLHPTFFPTIPGRIPFSKLFILSPYVVLQANKFQMLITTLLLSHTQVCLHARDEQRTEYQVAWSPHSLSESGTSQVLHLQSQDTHSMIYDFITSSVLSSAPVSQPSKVAGNKGRKLLVSNSYQHSPCTRIAPEFLGPSQCLRRNPGSCINQTSFPIGERTYMTFYYKLASLT